MGAPQGYTALGLVGYTDKGTYLASATYNRYNVVLYNGSSYVAIKDGITGVTPSNDGVNWRLFANGFPENGISTDNFQETLKQYISNSGTVNQEGFALDARQGNPNVKGSLAAQLITLTRKLTSSYEVIQISTTTGAIYGECQINYTDKGKTPIVIANTANNNMLITINNITATSCQFIVRNSKGEIMKEISVTINALIIWNGSTTP